ncbi:MAG TPA: hypothetical protein VLH75_20105 [Longimicrobiales bacterium]|nr:hypothetical protein [Longimicrobiales bacterium]
MKSEIDLPKTFLVVIALGELGGEADVEAIAIKAHELFPQVFSWKTRPDLPDKDVVRAHLSEAKKKKFGQLVADADQRKGKGVKRYALTATGAAKVSQLSSVVDRYGVGGSNRTENFRRIIDPILNSQAFIEFTGGAAMSDIGRDRYLEALRMFPDAGAYLISSRLARARNAAQAMPESRDKQGVIQFLGEGRDEFGL